MPQWSKVCFRRALVSICVLRAVRIVSFLPLFSSFAEKTLTNFNIQGTCFVNYKGPVSAENTHNFSYNTNNFYKVTNNFSHSPSNFTDF